MAKIIKKTAEKTMAKAKAKNTQAARMRLAKAVKNGTIQVKGNRMLIDIGSLAIDDYFRLAVSVGGKEAFAYIASKASKK